MPRLGLHLYNPRQTRPLHIVALDDARALHHWLVQHPGHWSSTVEVGAGKWFVVSNHDTNLAPLSIDGGFSLPLPVAEQYWAWVLREHDYQSRLSMALDRFLSSASSMAREAVYPAPRIVGG